MGLFILIGMCLFYIAPVHHITFRKQSIIPIQLTFVITGNPRKFSKINTQIREALVYQCGNLSMYCSHGAYKHEPKQELQQTTLQIQVSKIMGCLFVRFVLVYGFNEP